MRIKFGGCWALLIAIGVARPSGAAPLVGGGPGRVQMGQPDASRFPDVRLFVAPAAADGRPLGGLGAEQFQLFEDGRPAAITEFRDAGSAVPLEVCLAIDRSGSMADENKLASAQEAARQFVTAMRPTDRAAVVTFSSGATLDRALTVDRPSLLAVIAAMRPSGGTTFYDGVYWSVVQVSLRAPRANVLSAGTAGARRVVLALTDGNDNESRASERDVVRQARANGVTIYTIGLGSDTNRTALDRLATATGGRYFYAPTASQLALLYAHLAQQLQSEYAITYRTPRPDADGTRRAVEVRLFGRGSEGARERGSEGAREREVGRAAGWYQAPGVGSLVVSVSTGATSDRSPLAAPAAPARPAPVALLALAAGLAVGVTLALLALSRRRFAGSPVRRLAPSGEATVSMGARAGVGSSPRIDLRPLWARGTITRVGRAEENEVIIDNPFVSRRHARIERAGGAYRIFDQGSAHGTYVNGRRVEEAPLEVGDVIRFADEEFQFGGETAS